MAVEKACKRVVELYNTGTNCDKAVLLAMQETLNIPTKNWDFSRFYSDKPDDSDQFLCKVLVAGAIAIYIDVISKTGGEPRAVQAHDESTEDRVIHLFNRIIFDCSGEKGEDLPSFDPFANDPGLVSVEVSEDLRKEYTNRVTALFNRFKAQHPGANCVDIIGFDPFAYADYSEEIQEEIEKGEWMEKCIDCMKNVITGVKPIK